MDIKAAVLTGWLAVALAFGVACQAGPVATPGSSDSPTASPTKTAQAPSVDSPTGTDAGGGSPTEPAQADATPSPTETTLAPATPSPTATAPAPTAVPSPTPTPVPTPTATPAPTLPAKYSVPDGTPLHQAALDGEAAVVEQLLDEGADIEARAGIFYLDIEFLHAGATPLHVAAALNTGPGGGRATARSRRRHRGQDRSRRHTPALGGVQ